MSNAALVYRQPARKKAVRITDDVRRQVLDGLKHMSQQKLARQLGLSQSTISRIAREAHNG